MPASFSFTPNRAGQARLLQSPTGPLGRWMTRTGNQVVNRAKARANVDTGLMRSRIEFRLEVQQGQLVGVVAARTNYARYVHDGTRYMLGNPFLTDALRDVIG